jgi:molybdopterin adenylyltransferase
MRVAILTISTLGSQGKRADTSGDAIVEWAGAHKYTVAERALVADDVNAIVATLLAWCDSDSADLVLTTGGTGLSPTDRTPEATRAVIEREAQGISELLRASAAGKVPRAVLSRGVAGVRARTLVVNLPGSPGGVKESLATLDSIVEHAVAIVRGDAGDHGAA